MNFLLNILASIIASVLLLIIVGLISQKAKWLLIGILGRILNIDIEFIFSSRTVAAKDIMSEIKNADYVNIITSRGLDLESDVFSQLLGNRPNGSKTQFRILLPQTNGRNKKSNWAAINDAELKKLDQSYGEGLLMSQIKNSEKFLSSYLDSGLVDLRHFNMPHIGRILITNRVVYYTPYPKNKRADYAKIIKFRRMGDMSESYARLFDLLWENAPDAT